MANNLSKDISILNNTVFHDYFNDKTRLLSLCNSIVEKNYTDFQNLKFSTLQGNFFSGQKNDISCMIDNYVFILVENHNFINPNIAIRFFGYLTQIFKNVVEYQNTDDAGVKFSFPSPRCCIFYYGDKSDPFVRKIKLSDSFLGKSNALELIITVYNINHEMNQPLFANCHYLYEYSILIGKIKEKANIALNNREAISQAIKFCLKNGVMKNYLEKNSVEVLNMLALQWDSDTALQVRFEEGIEFVAKNMIRKNIPFEKIQEFTELSIERIKELSQNNLDSQTLN